MRLKAVVGMLVCAVALCAIGAPATADYLFGGVTPTHDYTAGAVVDGQPVAFAVQGANGQSLGSWSPAGGGGGGGGRPVICSYHAFGATDGTYAYTVDQTTPVTPEPDVAYTFMCRTIDGDVLSVDIVVYDPADPFAGALAEQRALDAALAALTLTPPAVSTNPPSGADHLVGLHTWVWHDGPWQRQSATATVATTSATVEASPTRLTIDPGDGTPPQRCTGPGRPPTSHTADRPTPGDCTHQWKHRSTRDHPEGTYPLTITIEWAAHWHGTTGNGGELGTLTTTATVPIRVREAQAVLHH
ncbi:MAG: hypothetical protein JJU45_20055 [Acidimicrobiia bacterium]|nr:hypothetical protein [Acidimicrobiia bacterium]MCC5954389.1 hypothetical protein [Acidimicrobiia bacterium]